MSSAGFILLKHGKVHEKWKNNAIFNASLGEESSTYLKFKSYKKEAHVRIFQKILPYIAMFQ